MCIESYARKFCIVAFRVRNSWKRSLKENDNWNNIHLLIVDVYVFYNFVQSVAIQWSKPELNSKSVGALIILPPYSPHLMPIEEWKQ